MVSGNRSPRGFPHLTVLPVSKRFGKANPISRSGITRSKINSSPSSQNQAIMMREYRCTCNAPYQHPCAGQLDIRERQGYYIWADCEEAAWEQMAQKFPDETKAGFTTQEWEGFNVRIVERRKD